MDDVLVDGAEPNLVAQQIETIAQPRLDPRQLSSAGSGYTLFISKFHGETDARRAVFVTFS
ncbi:hypothetical protein [Bradyrhizobium sp.]|uniref:hypothetical protein n=1 Tax=Bradyrhizobium sp. TaxID=376 RepID=UPI0027356F10|nr:hypothetical protein [Bradyrhizobium sp.]MDP3694408.1 hypothetical protein [Bradyrhizobium sp.]